MFGPFSESTDYFGRAEQQWMINFRVDDLDGLIAKLQAGSQWKLGPNGTQKSVALPAFTIPKEIRLNSGSRRRSNGERLAMLGIGAEV